MTSKFALVIANTEYQDASFAKLTAPGKDAEEFAHVLREPELAAFDDVQVLLNEGEGKTRRSIARFFVERKPADLLLLYFSGHGVRNEQGQLFLAANDTEITILEATGIPAEFITRAMNNSRSQRQLLILDCCNSGAFAHGSKSASGVGKSMGIATAFEGDGYGRVVLTATDATQFAWEGDKVIGDTQKSVFTYFLIEGLKGEADRDGDGRIKVDELYDYAYEEVVRRTPKQTPGKWSYKQQGDIILRENLKPRDVKPAPLPSDLLDLLSHPNSSVRRVGIQDLISLLDGKHLGLARGAEERLREIAANDDSLSFRKTASDALNARGLSHEKPILIEAVPEKPIEEKTIEKPSMPPRRSLSLQEFSYFILQEFSYFMVKIASVPRKLFEQKIAIPKLDKRLLRIVLGISLMIVFLGWAGKAIISNWTLFNSPPMPTYTLTSTVLNATAQPAATSTPAPLSELLSVPYTATPLYVNTPHSTLAADMYSSVKLAYEKGDWDEVIRGMQKILQVEPQAADTYYYIGEAYRFKGDPTSAIAAYQSALDVNQSFGPGYVGLARARLLEDPNANVLSLLDQGIRLDPNFGEAYLERASVKLRENDIQGALTDLSSANGLLPNSPLVFFQLAQARLKDGDIDLALNAAKRANELDITMLPTYLLLGQLYTEAGNDEEALKALEIYLKYVPNDAEAFATYTALAERGETSVPPTPTIGIGSTMISDKDGMILLYVPAGEFTMGSETNDNEKPVHKVTLDAFWIDQTEVTNKMYELCVSAGVCKVPTNTSSFTHSSYYGNSEYDNHPVIYVDWNMAKTYCEWADRRLPTEAEWEKAARGENAFAYPWGNDAPNNNLLNYNNNVGDTTEVGKYPDGASPYGALDMAGNVREWVADWYSDTYYASSPTSNPLGPDSGQVHVLRDGSWSLNLNGVRSAFRRWTDSYYYIGFRCAASQNVQADSTLFAHSPTVTPSPTPIPSLTLTSIPTSTLPPTSTPFPTQTP